MRATVLSTLGVLMLAAGCQSPVVGAACRGDLALCDGLCVDLESDPQHCGACGTQCASDQSCVLGAYVGLALDGGGGDASGGDAGVIGDGSFADADVTPRDGGPRDGGDGGAPPEGCDVGELECGAICVRPDSDPANCGGCGIACAMGDVCAGGECTDACRLPRMTCDDRCIDTRSDPDHCGGCDNACPSGVCMAGECSGPLAGHLVVVGHDYRESRADMNRIAGNAVFLARQNPPRVLVYEGDARPSAIAGTDAAIDQVAALYGRSWARTAAPRPEEIPLMLLDADVLVVYAQTDAADGELQRLSQGLARSLTTFLQTGGVIVVFDGAGSNRGTFQVVTGTGFFWADSRTDVSRRVLDVVSPGDAVALGVPIRYRGEVSTVRFDTTEMTVVVDDGAGGPVVIHRTVLP